MVSSVVVILLAGGLAVIHVLAGNLRFLQGLPRSLYLSLAGGVSVAYVFVHLLPEIAERQSEIAGEVESAHAVFATVNEQVLFLAVLVGFATFYGFEQLAVRSRQAGRQAVAGDVKAQPSARVFWLHVGSFTVYNALVGYLLLHREETGTVSLLLYFTAMALHFVVNDYGLREHHQNAYVHLGRWILAGAVFAGVLIGFLATVSETLLGLLFAFLSGAIILNVIKEELPEERESSFWAFGTGLASYTALLLL